MGFACFVFSELRSTRVCAGLGCNHAELFDYVGPIYMLLSLHIAASQQSKYLNLTM